MALSTRKINLIIADAKAKKFESITQLCKHHKISTRTYYNLEKRYHFRYGENNDIVEASVIIERAKSNLKNSQEIHSINKAVQERISTIEDDNKLIQNNRKISALVQARIVANKEDIEVHNAKDVMSAIKQIEDIANPKESKTNINIQNNQITNFESDYLKAIQSQFKV